MGLGSRKASRHETAASERTAGVRSEDYWAFQPGASVMTVDGILGTVTAVQDGPTPGNEAYEVTLAKGMGGGLYTSSQLSPAASTTASTEKTAAEDYPELGTILNERPDPAINTVLASRTASLDDDTAVCDHCNQRKHVDEFADLGGDRDGDSGPVAYPATCQDCADKQYQDAVSRYAPRASKTAAGKCSLCNGEANSALGNGEVLHDTQWGRMHPSCRDEWAGGGGKPWGYDIDAYKADGEDDDEPLDPKHAVNDAEMSQYSSEVAGGRQADMDAEPREPNTWCGQCSHEYHDGDHPDACPECGAKDHQHDIEPPDDQDDYYDQPHHYEPDTMRPQSSLSGPPPFPKTAEVDDEDEGCEYCGGDHKTEDHEDEPDEEDAYVHGDGRGSDANGTPLPVRAWHGRKDLGAFPTEGLAHHAIEHESQKSGYYPNVWKDEGQGYRAAHGDFAHEHAKYFKDGPTSPGVEYNPHPDEHRPVDEYSSREDVEKHLMDHHGVGRSELMQPGESSDSWRNHLLDQVGGAPARERHKPKPEDMSMLLGWHDRKHETERCTEPGCEYTSAGHEHGERDLGGLEDSVNHAFGDDTKQMWGDHLLSGNEIGPTKYSSKTADHGYHEDLQVGPTSDDPDDDDEVSHGHDTWRGEQFAFEPGLGCPHCKDGFMTEDSRTRHIREQHPGEYSGPTDDLMMAKDRIDDIKRNGAYNPDPKFSSLDPYSIVREAATDGEFRFEVTASWSDVRNKAKRIRTEGGVRIVAASSQGVQAEVKGDHHIYETGLQYMAGSRKVAIWQCGCKWAAYAWGRSPRYKRFEGRMCSHALAVQFEAASRGMFGREVGEGDPLLPGQKKRTPVVIQFDKADDKNRTRRTVPPGNMRTVWSKRVEDPLIIATVAHMASVGDDPDEIGLLLESSLIASASLVRFAKMAAADEHPCQGCMRPTKGRSMCTPCQREGVIPLDHGTMDTDLADLHADTMGGLHHKADTEGWDRSRLSQNAKMVNLRFVMEQAKRDRANPKPGFFAHPELNELAEMTHEMRYGEGGDPTWLPSQFQKPHEAAVNNAWGEPAPPQQTWPTLPGATQQKDPNENPASAGFAAGPDPIGWQTISPLTMGDRVASHYSEEAEDGDTDVCLNCGESIKRTTMDPNVPWIHHRSGNSKCDVDSPADAVMLQGVDSGEAAPIMHEASQNDEDTSLWDSNDQNEYGVQADLHDDPEPALPSTDGSTENLLGNQQDQMHAVYDDALSPEDSSIQTVGAASEEESPGIAAIIAEFQRTAGAAVIMKGGESRGEAGPSDMDIAAAARAHLEGKTAMRAFSPSEQQQLINEKGKARNTDMLDIGDTHYARLDELRPEDDDEDWMG